MKLVYLCHPLTGDGSPAWGNRARNVERYLAFCRYAMEQGHAVLSWVHHELLYERGLREPFDYWLDRDVALLLKADEVWLCGPLAVSRGMRVECKAAMAAGIVVRTCTDWDYPDWFPPGTVRQPLFKEGDIVQYERHANGKIAVGVVREVLDLDMEEVRRRRWPKERHCRFAYHLAILNPDESNPNVPRTVCECRLSREGTTP